MKIFVRFVALAMLLLLVAGVVFYERPLWVGDQRLDYAMWRGGARSRTVDVAEGRIHYYEEAAKSGGDGVPLLLIHGLGGRSEDFASLMRDFSAQGFHVYAPDLLGYGRSDKPAGSDYSIATEVRVVTEFMDAVHVPRAKVVGWSMGGWIALKLALDAPERVERMAVYDAAGIVFDTKVEAGLFTPTDAAGLELLVRTLSPTMTMPPVFAQKDVFRKFADERWVIERSMAAMKSGKDIVDNRLAGMKPPLLIVYGAQDVLTPPSVGETMHRMDPRSVYASVEGCGHFAPVECSAAVGKVTVEFFKAEPAMVGGELKLAR